jgi:acyl-homoserine lactone acylase PvdQ
LNVEGCVINHLVWIGHNERVAWGGSANWPDLTDVYEEKLNPENPRQYLYEGEWRNMTVHKTKIAVKTKDGRDEVERELLYTHHGPVFQMDEKRGRAYSWRTGLYDSVGMIAAHYGMAKAKSVGEFKRALSSLDMTAAPNVIAGDKDGNIFYVHYGKMPVRSDEYDWTKSVPGWTKETEWQGFVPFEKLAQVENPQCGFVQTSNEAPWFVCPDSGLSRGQFSVCEVPDKGWGSTWTWRGKRLTQLLASKPTFSLDEVQSFAMDTYVLMAEQWKPVILAGYEARKARGGGISEELSKAIAILREWDNRSTKQSVGVTVFHAWYTKFQERHNASGAIPHLETDLGQQGGVALEALEEAVQELLEWYGTVEKPWGEVHLLKHGAGTYAMGAGQTNLQTVHIASSPGADNRGVYYCDHGSSYMFVCELGDPIRAFTIKPFGQSGDATSPHFADQTELFSRMEFKPFWFSQEEVLEHVESAWGTHIALGTRDIGYEATVEAAEPITILPTCSTDNPVPALPQGTKAVSRFVTLESRGESKATVRMRLYASEAAEGVPVSVLRTAAVYLIGADGAWQRCSASTIDPGTRSVGADGLPLGTYVALVQEK